MKMRKFLAVLLVCFMALGMLAGCGDNSGNGGDEAKGGKILWLSNLSSGIQYEAMKAYAEDVCKAYGYTFEIVYGDMFNDPAGNLNAIKNAMTDDVVGIVASQDGGIKDIMAEYPEVYVAGYNTDMNSVYSSDSNVATNAAVATNDHFLGTIADGHIDGATLGKQMFDAVVAAGYKKVSTVIFPVYAYPNLTAGDISFRALVEEYNKTAADADKIEIVGDAKVLEFQPMEESYFLEPGNSELECIVGLCAGVDFIYPAVKSAIANGSVNKDIKLITSGFNDSAEIVADMGGDGVIQYVSISPAENIGWPLTMLHKAISGEMYSDYTASERFDSLEYIIDSKEDIDNVMSKSMNGTGDPKFAQITIDDLKAADSYAALKALFMSDQLKVDALAK